MKNYIDIKEHRSVKSLKLISNIILTICIISPASSVYFYFQNDSLDLLIYGIISLFFGLFLFGIGKCIVILTENSILQMGWTQYQAEKDEVVLYFKK